MLDKVETCGGQAQRAVGVPFRLIPRLGAFRCNSRVVTVEMNGG
jgi:hypothetical protein